MCSNSAACTCAADDKPSSVTTQATAVFVKDLVEEAERPGRTVIMATGTTVTPQGGVTVTPQGGVVRVGWLQACDPLFLLVLGSSLYGISTNFGNSSHMGKGSTCEWKSTAGMLLGRLQHTGPHEEVDTRWMSEPAEFILRR